MQQEEITRHDIRAIVSDLEVLAEHILLRNFTRYDSDHDRLHIEGTFHAFIRHKKIYDQARFISADGMEQVRADWNNGKPGIAPKPKMQDKSQRYYFTDTMNLRKGEIFVSPFDLNIEHGELEKPLKPMIRFAAPVFNRFGEKTGMVILNFLGIHLIKDLNKLQKNGTGDILLINKDGYYLRCPDAFKEWGFMFPDRKDVSFKNDFPAAWQEISVKDQGQVVTPNGLFTYAGIHPLYEGLHSSTGSPEACSKSSRRLSDRDYSWKLISHVHPRELKIIEHPYSTAYIGFNFILLLIIGAGCSLATYSGCRHREAERQLRQEQHKFKTLADFTHDWEYWVGTDGSYIYTSPSSKRITGYGPEDFQADPDLLIKLTHPEDREIINDHLHMKYFERNENISSIDFRIITAEGDVRWLSHVCQAIYDDAGCFLGRRASNRDITQRKQTELELKEMATHDGLTGLPNRKLMYDRLVQILARAERGRQKVAILFIDLDKFKEINDGLGHDAGDAVLIETASRMENVLRKSDTVARMGGDEFVVVLTDIRNDADVDDVAKKLIHAINQAIPIEQNEKIVEGFVGASIGISTYPADGYDIDTLISNADNAMYRAKKAGRNQFARPFPEESWPSDSGNSLHSSD